MNEQDADRLRDAIAREQRWTLCRCGHILECCADCRGWLIEHSPRIAMGWVAWWRCVTEYADILTPTFRQHIAYVDTTEAADRAYFGL